MENSITCRKKIGRECQKQQRVRWIYVTKKPNLDGKKKIVDKARKVCWEQVGNANLRPREKISYTPDLVMMLFFSKLIYKH